MTLKPSSCSNPCPICGDTRKKCRHHHEEDKHLCMTFVDLRKGEVVNGYKCTGLTKCGTWAQFILDNTAEWTEERKREWEAQVALRQEKAKEEDRARQAKALPVHEINELYRDILEQLTLNSKTIEDFKRRGFSDEEIERSGFKSVAKRQKLSKEYTTDLPGIAKDGKSLVIGDDGYLCPIRDFDGRITGMQVRRHNADQLNRYYWLSTPTLATLKLQPEDENPLAVFHPPGGKPQAIAIVEGVGAKPFFVSERMNCLVIGAAGGQWLASEKLLEKYIKAAFEKYGELPIQVIPDAGWALNWQVKQKLSDVIDWLTNKFNKLIISVLDWNQIHKSQGDIDEFENSSIARTLKASSFLKKYKEVFNYQGFEAKRYHQWAHERVKLTADIVQHEKWLTIPEGIQTECDILLIRKSLGGGKTQTLIEFLKPLDIVTLLVGYRNSLLNNTIERANNLGLSALHIKEVVEKIKGDYINFAADDSVKLWGGCADSFFKFDSIISHHPQYYFVHDEICSVLGHLKGGGTLKGRQQQAIEWDVSTIRNSQFCIMMDANLSDKEVNFLRQVFPEKRIKVLDSINEISPRTFYFIETEKEEEDYTRGAKFLPSQLVEIAKRHDKILWLSDAQTSCEIADEILTKHGHKHYRLDGKTSQDEIAKLFQKNPGKFILSENLDSVSVSPSGESGLSIDGVEGYFDAVCFDIRGTVGVNALTQLSARLRDTKVPIYVSCPEFVNMTSDPCPYALKNVGEVLNQRIDQLLIQSLNSDKELLNSESIDSIFDSMKEQFSQDKWFLESLKDAKQLKYEHQNLKLTLKTALAQAGHKVIDYVDKADDEQYQEVKETKELVVRREAEKIFNAPDIDYERAQELAKQEVNYDVKCQIRKARLKHQLPGIEDTPSWSADFIYTVLLNERNFLDQRWRLKQLEDEELFKAVFKFEKKYNFEFGFTASDAWKSSSIKVEALKLLGVEKIIQASSFSSQDDWVQAIVDQYYATDEWFNLIGITRAKQSVNADGSLKKASHITTMVGRFVEYFGLECRQAKKIRGSRSFVVAVPKEIEKYLPDIDQCLKTKASAIISQMGEVSLQEICDKAEQDKQQIEILAKKQAELNKRILENQLTHSDSDLGGIVSFSSYKYNQNDAPYHTPFTPKNTEINAWRKPETITETAEMLALCEDAETLALLRQCEIPSEVFKLAARTLPLEKREQIRTWVMDAAG